MQKELKKEPKKEYYIIEVEGLMPVKARFRVLSENEEDACKIFETRPDLCYSLGQPQPMPGKIINKKISIRHSLSALITWIKKY